MLEKPPRIANDPYRSAKWDEICAGRKFTQADAPVIATLCQWYRVLDTAIDEMDSFGGQTAYTNDTNDLKAMPQIATMKTASAEIRQLNKQLGICDTREEDDTGGNADNVLTLFDANRKTRSARAAG